MFQTLKKVCTLHYSFCMVAEPVPDRSAAIASSSSFSTSRAAMDPQTGSVSRSPSSFPTQQAAAGKRRAGIAGDVSEAPSATRTRTAAPPVSVHIASTPASPVTDALGRERSASATPVTATTASPVRGRRIVDAPRSPAPGCDAEALRVYVKAMFDSVEGILAKILKEHAEDRTRVDELYQWPLQLHQVTDRLNAVEKNFVTKTACGEELQRIEIGRAHV